METECKNGNRVHEWKQSARMETKWKNENRVQEWIKSARLETGCIA